MAIFYRLIKPIWGRPHLSKKRGGEWIKEPNPDFIREVKGPDVLEGCDFTLEFIKQKNLSGYNIYWMPNHPSTNIYKEQGVIHANGKHIDVLNYVFVDMDLKDGTYNSIESFLNTLSEFPLKPSMTVISGNGVHSYWKVSDLTRDSYVLLQHGLLNMLKTDDSVWSLFQLLRFPNTKNTKKENEYKDVRVDKKLSSGNVYKVNDLLEIVKVHISQDDAKRCKTHLDKLDGKLEINIKAEDLDLGKLPAKFEALLESSTKVYTLFHNPKEIVSDRSAADMKLANILFNEGFNVNEATQILTLTEKAREKGSNALAYALNTIGKVYNDRPKYKYQTVSEYLKNVGEETKEPPVNGPYYMDTDVLVEPWRKKELLGIIAGSGVGKTALALNIIKEMIQNNSQNNDIFIFFSLEMTKGQIIQRWINLVGRDSALADRLYVVDTTDENNMPMAIGLQEIYNICKELKQTTAKEIGAIILDHFHIVSRHIDITKTPNFGIDSVHNSGKGNIRQLLPNDMASQLKSLVKTLNTFGVILSQTTKEKGAGDVPIGKEGAYGVSQFEWIVDRIITIWQPLMRVYDLTPLRFLAFQYAKIREKREKDSIQELKPKLLLYDMKTGDLQVPSNDDFQEFIRLAPLAKQARQDAEKKNTPEYAIQVDIKKLKDLVLNKKVKK